jgi:Zn-dependent protease
MAGTPTGTDVQRHRPHRSSLRIGRLWGVEIRLHWTFLVFLLFVAAAGSGAGLWQVGAWMVWLVAVFASVLVHELAHCVVARRRGAVVDDILLTPLGGMSQLEDLPEKAGDELAIAVVGPLTSLGLAVAAGVTGIALGSRVWPPTLFAGSWWARLLWLNVVLGAFNFLPALPMDGGRVLRAALERRSGDRRAATRQAAGVARFVAFLMMVAGVFYDVWLLFIGVFVLLGASAEEAAAEQPPPHAGNRPAPHPGDWPPPHAGERPPPPAEHRPPPSP